LLDIATTNVIAPYEIRTSSTEQKEALESLAKSLGFCDTSGTKISEALAEARKAVKPQRDRKPLIGLAVAGAGLLLAGPVGLLWVAPTGLAGGAAIVAALAGFGPGGMLGGLWTAAGLMAAGGGTSVAAVKGLISAPEAVVESAVARLLATAIARNALDVRRDDRVWFILCELETQIASELQRLTPYSDAESSSIQVLRRKAQAVRQAIEYMVDTKLAPVITDAPATPPE